MLHHLLILLLTLSALMPRQVCTCAYTEDVTTHQHDEPPCCPDHDEENSDPGGPTSHGHDSDCLIASPLPEAVHTTTNGNASLEADLVVWIGCVEPPRSSSTTYGYSISERFAKPVHVSVCVLTCSFQL